MSLIRKNPREKVTLIPLKRAAEMPDLDESTAHEGQAGTASPGVGHSLQEVELAVGRRAQDGKIRLSVFAPRVLALSVQYGAERAPTVMLTLDQVGELRQALANFEQAMTQEPARDDLWDGIERRRRTAA